MSDPTIQTGTMGSTPPMAEQGGQPPVFDQQAEANQDASNIEQRRHFASTRAKLGAAAVGAIIVLGGAIGFIQSRDGSKVANADSISALDNGHKYDACPDGMFPNGAYESSLDVSNPNDLHRRPADTLNDASNLTDYFFGSNGVACESAATLAVVKEGYMNMLGDGAAKTFGFDVLGSVNEQADIYTNKTDVAQSDADKLASIMEANSQLNPVELQGAYYQVVGVKEGDKVVAQLNKVQVKFAKETVFVTIVGGDARANNQIMVTDRETGQVFFLNAVGSIPEVSPQDQLQQSGGNGGGQFGTINGSGESNQPGNVPESGGNGGFTPGRAPSFGPGGGGGGGGTTTTERGGGTTTTTRPSTTTTSQVTTTTTTQPKGIDPGQPGGGPT
ncbi:MAG: hypothetical protein WCJ24_00010 [Candidatus Saccharibacteria bacterium]